MSLIFCLILFMFSFFAPLPTMALHAELNKSPPLDIGAFMENQNQAKGYILDQKAIFSLTSILFLIFRSDYASQTIAVASDVPRNTCFLFYEYIQMDKCILSIPYLPQSADGPRLPHHLEFSALNCFCHHNGLVQVNQK